MLKVSSITDTPIDYNGYGFVLGTISSQKLENFPAAFPADMDVREGDYLDEISMDLTTALVDGEYVECVRIREATICDEGPLDVFIKLDVLGRVFKPRNLGKKCPRVGLDARPRLRFTLKSKDAYDRLVSRPALAKGAAPKVFELADRTLILANVCIIPDNVHGYVLYVQSFELRGGL